MSSSLIRSFCVAGLFLLCSNSVQISGQPVVTVGPKPVPVTATPTPAVNNPAAVAAPRPQQPETLGEIGGEFFGGLLAIRDSAGRVVGWGVRKAEQGVEAGVKAVVEPVVEGVNAVVQPIATGVRNVATAAVNVKNNIKNAGGQIVDAWGNAITQTGQITSNLVSGNPTNTGRK